MIDDYLSKNLKEGETVLRIVRQYPIGLITRLAAFGLISLTDFFFMAFLLRRGGWGLLLFVGGLGLMALLSYRAWYLWSMNALIVTDQRIVDIDQRGFFTRTVSETSYRKIQDISYTVAGLLPTLFRYGTVSIQTAGTQTKIELDRIRHPEQLQDLLTGLQEQPVEVREIRAESGPGEGGG